MAAKTLYLTDALADAWQALAESSPGADATTSPNVGWTVAKVAASNYAPLKAGTELSGAFSGTVHPNGALDAANGDAARAGPFSGTFAAATWTLHHVVIAAQNGGTQDGRARVRVFKGPNADGSGATELTGATLLGVTLTNIATSAAQDSSVTWSPGAVALDGDYLFFEIGWEITGAGGNNNCDVIFRIGDTGTRIDTPDFATNITGTLAATETGSDTFAAAGSVLVQGTLATTETGSDTFASAGSVLVQGTLATTETGSDTFAASGTLGSLDRVGDLAATETGSDTFAAAGSVLVQGTLAATETGADTFAAAGSVLVQGTLATTETGADTFAATGGPVITGTLATTETGSDTFAATGVVYDTPLPAVFEADLQALAPGAIIEMFELDATAIGGTLLRWHNGVNALGNDVTWQGNVYSRFPVEAEGFERSGAGKLPRPTLRVANISGLIGALARELSDLVTARVTRRRTFVKYLDAVNFPGGVNPTADPNVGWPDEVWFVDRKAMENGIFVEFELAAAYDLAGVMLPRRQFIQNVCTWRYRSAECGYAGGAVAMQNDQPTADPDFDSCGKRLVSCQWRFGAHAELPYGGFPGVGLVR